MINGEKLEDLAWDFIADIFEKDEEGELIKLKEYFTGLEVRSLSEKQIRIELRRLVFTKVEDNIFRSLGKKDPSLRKIIRNLKLAIRDEKCRNCVCYQNGLIIVDTDNYRNLPVMPSELMQIKLCSRLEEKMQIPEILIEVIDILTYQNRYRKEFSLVALASIIRETFVQLNEPLSEKKEQPDIEKHMFYEDFENFLNVIVEKTRKSTGISYIQNGKVTECELDIYMNAAKEIVRDHFTEGRKEFSQFECLKLHMPDLEYSDFRNNRRKYLEYIVNQVKKDVISTFKEDWF